MDYRSRAATLGRVIGHVVAITGMGACLAIVIVTCAVSQGGGWLPYIAGFSWLCYFC